MEAWGRAAERPMEATRRSWRERRERRQMEAYDHPAGRPEAVAEGE